MSAARQPKNKQKYCFIFKWYRNRVPKPIFCDFWQLAKDSSFNGLKNQGSSFSADELADAQKACDHAKAE
jgi:hypothetical protein